jgi:hypothetical protein
MPKYEIIYDKTKVKVIRASSLEIAAERANKGATNGWNVATVTEKDKE